MKFLVRSIPFLFLGLLLWTPGRAPGAQVVFSTSGQSDSLDNNNIDARSAAMGSASVGVADDASALFVNPAGLAGLRKAEASVNSNFWLGNILQETVLLGFPTADLGGFAVAGNYVDFGTFDSRDELGDLTGNYGANRLALEVGWGFALFTDLSVGAGIQGSQMTLDNNSYSDFSSSLGMLLTPFKGFRLGVSCDHLGIFSQSGPQEGAFNVGASYEKELDPSNRFLIALSGSVEPSSVNYLQAGVEYGLRSRFFFRVGYQLPLASNGIEGLSGLSTGVGFTLSDLSFDYAYLPYGELGSSHRVTLGFRFDAMKPTRQTPPGEPPPPSPEIAPTGTSVSIVGTPAPALKIQPNSASKDSLTVRFDLPPDTLAQGKELEKEGKRQEAIQLYMEAVKNNNEDVLGWWALGNTFYRLNLKVYAVYCFERVVQLEPGNKSLSDWLRQYQAASP